MLSGAAGTGSWCYRICMVLDAARSVGVMVYSNACVMHGALDFYGYYLRRDGRISMIPRITHQVWLGPAPVPRQHDLWRERLIALNPDWQHYWHAAFGDQSMSAAAESNILRLYMLHKYGGIYLDTDCEPIKPLAPLLEHEAFIARQPDGVFCNAVMGATPKHPWIKWMLDRALAEQHKHDAAWACHMIAESPMEGVSVVPTELFYSWNWDQQPAAPHPEALVAHHWSGSWLKG